MSSKKGNSQFQSDKGASGNSPLPAQPNDIGQAELAQVALRFNREYRGEAFELPAELEAMPIFREWATGALQAKVASAFWTIAQPEKNQHCLDIGCGVSFLVYPWRDWGAFFYGQEISTVARDALNSRGPQLNSKLFKGVELGPAHRLNYQADRFDLAIATGLSCYFSLDYWTAVMAEAKRVLKPDGPLVFDVLDPEKPLAEDWALLETYKGAEVFLEPIAEWEKTIKAAGAQVVKRQPGELFQLYKVRF